MFRFTFLGYIFCLVFVVVVVVFLLLLLLLFLLITTETGCKDSLTRACELQISWLATYHGIIMFISLYYRFPPLFEGLRGTEARLIQSNPRGEY